MDRPNKRPKGEEGSVPVFVSQEEEEEALRFARISKAAEMKALQKEEGLQKAKKSEPEGPAKPTFMTKAERQAAALQRLEERRQQSSSAAATADKAAPDDGEKERARERARASERERARAAEAARSGASSSNGATMGGVTDRAREKELQEIRDSYLGKKLKKKNIVKPSEKFSKIFQFDWEAGDDTSNDLNPIYSSRMAVQPLFGRGYIAGVDLQEQRRQSAFNKTLIEKRQAEERQAELEGGTLTAQEIQDRERARRRVGEELREAEAARNKKLAESGSGLKGKHWKEKELGDMNERDWRIFREDYDIVVRGGRAPLPMRDWTEAKEIPELLLKAIEDLKYKEPSPIQRQAIPIGLQWRDIIGIAETGSGKTCAFAVPMLAYIANLPEYRRERLADEGPLAMIMAPTRELAQQIEKECQALAVHLGYKTVSVVGGQSIEDQGFILRKGVEVLIGTPGRMKDAIESRYLVLNQCNYVILDEADRMVDMGFENELNFVLDSMAGLLKSEAEDEAYKQEEASKRGEALFRVTAMFSATMPPAVEKLAKAFLRHPAIVSIGDRSKATKNLRIDQSVDMVNEAAKPMRLVDACRPGPDDKIIVFVNEKKRCDMVSRAIEKAGVRTAILHGGKSQDQREESLQNFRDGHFQVLVATDVAGRGLDIPDVSMVINYDMPAKLEAYCHRIGRTGRAGKSGRAVTFLTEADSEVYYDLKNYLEACDVSIPHNLARHPAAAAAPGTLTEGGRSATSRKDTVIFS